MEGSGTAWTSMELTRTPGVVEALPMRRLAAATVVGSVMVQFVEEYPMLFVRTGSVGLTYRYNMSLVPPRKKSHLITTS